MEGFRCIPGHTVLPLSFLADIVAMALGMPRALFPQFASETFAPYGEGSAPGLLSAATDEMRGRTQGVFTVVVAGGPRPADVLHGTAGSAVGPRTAVAGGGILVVVVMPGLAAAVPAPRRYRV